MKPELVATYWKLAGLTDENALNPDMVAIIDDAFLQNLDEIQESHDFALSQNENDQNEVNLADMMQELENFDFCENVNAENYFDNDSIILELVPETQDVEIIKVSAPKRKLQMPITHFFKKTKNYNL